MLDKIIIKLAGGEPVVLPVSRAVEQTADMEDIYIRIVSAHCGRANATNVHCQSPPLRRSKHLSVKTR